MNVSAEFVGTTAAKLFTHVVRRTKEKRRERFITVV
jgi:hypothetical protein